MRTVERVLVVEDNRSLLRTLEEALRARFPDVRAGRGIADVSRLIDGWSPDLVILDFQLADGDARSVLDLAALREPAPVVVAVSGEASPVDTFELAHRGVRAFIPKPVTLDELERAIAVALETAPRLEPHLRQAVGHHGLAAMTEEVRAVMIDEALARAAGSRRAAARILDTSRQLLQYLLRRR
ncbi:MAG: response regulator [Kofleriaceae bacterium]|nr:MAG: response regulator [Kofleriaceae bacterium]MBZ0237163.1 response regulator [Kofleriaceae bacterium]